VSYVFYTVLLAILFAGMVRHKESLAAANGGSVSIAQAA
jgi:hypothetical protein